MSVGSDVPDDNEQQKEMLRQLDLVGDADDDDKLTPLDDLARAALDEIDQFHPVHSES